MSGSLVQAVHDALHDSRKVPHLKSILPLVAQSNTINELGSYVDKRQSLCESFPLQLAVAKPALARLLLSWGADPHAGEFTGHVRVRSASSSTTSICHALKRDATTPLFQAIQNGDANLVVQ